MRYRECSLLFGLVFAAMLAAARPSTHAQELQVQPTPFSVWLDFEKLSAPNPQKVSLPIWMESVLSHSIPAQDGAPEQTAFRIRLRRMAHLNSEIQLRVFFQDVEGRAPMVTAWTETGSLRYQSSPLGAALDLPSSATLTIPVQEVDYVVITTLVV